MRRGISGGVSITAEQPPAIRRVAITGASGLIGGALTDALRRDGIAVLRIGRGRDADVRWDVDQGVLDAAGLEDLGAVVNLAGATIAQRWTTAHRRAIHDSRVHGTLLLARALAGLRRPPPVLLSGSAMGVYGDRGDEVLRETSSLGTGFLADVARAWELATRGASEAGIAVAHLRTGLALSRYGGALPKMITPFRFGVGGVVGTGRQWMSWVGLHDLVRAIRFVMVRRIAGPVNIVAPNPVTGAEFAKTLGAVLHRPSLVPVPAFALRLAFGAMADQTLLASQRVIPEQLTAAGFSFDEPDLSGALRRETQHRA